MKLKELQNELNKYIEIERLNTLEKQNEQTELVNLIENKVYNLLRKNYSELFSRIISKRNHIVITKSYRYPLEWALIDISIKFKMGNKHTDYSYTQCYYISSIEVKSTDEDIETVEDVIKKIDDYETGKKLQREQEIESVKEFMQQHNLSYNETREFVELFKKYEYSIR